MGRIVFRDIDSLAPAGGEEGRDREHGCEQEEGAHARGIILFRTVSEAVPTPEELRSALGLLPTGVTIVSTPGPEGPAGATANAVTSLSLDPPLMLAALDRGSRTLAALQEVGRFGVNVLRGEHAELARAFSGPFTHAERWSDVAWGVRHGVPVLDEALAWVACELRESLDGGDHVILVGDVVGLGANGDGEPLVFHQGSYRALGDQGG
jgi:flavin reductase (DIM6/NTAB) family NADH-FMN oxidoreductase RutF